MPVGCNFICENEKCQNHKTGLTISGPWPLGDIKLIIAAFPRDIEYEPHKETMKKMKKEGRKYACISFPNEKNIPIVGYRVQKWCSKCPAIWNYDVMVANIDENKIEDMVKDAEKSGDVATKCPKCDSVLMNFNEVIEAGIKCLECKEELKQHRWWTKS